MGRFVRLQLKMPGQLCRPLRRASLTQGRLSGTRSLFSPLPGTAVPGFQMPSLRDLVLFISILTAIFVGAPLPAQTAAPASPESKPKADVIFVHANVYTGVPANAQFSSILREEAIAVRGDRIQAVGKNADILKLKGPQTQVIDLGGHFVMPGFNDAHLHLAEAGLQKLSADLTGVKTLAEFR